MAAVAVPTPVPASGEQAVARVRNPLHYALAVGIDRYPGISDLRAPSKDAQDFRQWLTDSSGGGLDPRNIELVHAGNASFDHPDNAVPTRTLVNNALERLFEDVEVHLRRDPLAWHDTRLYVYLSGHGVATDVTEAALLMANARRNRKGESVPSRRYLEFFQDTQHFRELVFFADCCRTRTVAHIDLAGPPWERRTGQRGRVSWLLGFATAFGDAAFEQTEDEEADPDKARGHFTRALLEGLRGKAARAGRVDSNGLAAYVRDRVLALTNNRQSTTTVSDPAQPVFFCDVPNVPLPQVTLHWPEGFDGSADLYDGKEVWLASHNAHRGPWTLRLERGLYEIRLGGQSSGTLFKVLEEDGHVRL